MCSHQSATHEGLPGTGYSQECLVCHVHRQGGHRTDAGVDHWEPPEHTQMVRGTGQANVSLGYSFSSL